MVVNTWQIPWLSRPWFSFLINCLFPEKTHLKVSFSLNKNSFQIIVLTRYSIEDGSSLAAPQMLLLQVIFNKCCLDCLLLPTLVLFILLPAARHSVPRMKKSYSVHCSLGTSLAMECRKWVTFYELLNRWHIIHCSIIFIVHVRIHGSL